MDEEKGEKPFLQHGNGEQRGRFLDFVDPPGLDPKDVHGVEELSEVIP